MEKTRFDKLIENLPGEIWQKIAQIDELKGRWVGSARLHPQTLGRLKKSVLVTSSGSSTRIEGAKLTDEQIEKLLRGIDIQKLGDRDSQEVAGYYELLSHVFEAWETLNVSEGLIKSLHEELLKYAEKDKLHRGEYKHSENKVHMVNSAGESVGILFDTTPAYLTSAQMHELVEWVRTESNHHPLLVIGVFVIVFLAIHPFTDGNGRLSRILTNLVLLRAGYSYISYVSHEKLIEDNKPEYYLALRTSQKTLKTKQASVVVWLEFFLTILVEQAKLAIKLIEIEDPVLHLSLLQAKAWEYMQEKKEVSPRELAGKLKIPRPTINQIANRLLQMKLITRVGMGRSVRYRASEELGEAPTA